jgi:hypothetical protein
MSTTPVATNGNRPEATNETVPWARQSTVARERATPRVRQMVEGLPPWEPLPPGEMLVRRRGATY